jgi:hypothetical protein
MKKGLRNKIMKFPRDAYCTAVGSFVISEYMLGKISLKRAIKYYRKYAKQDLNLEFSDVPSLVHAICIFFGIKEDLDQPIAAVTTEWGSLGFAVYIVTGEDQLRLLPNTEDGIPVGFIQHPKNIYNLKGDLLCLVKEEKTTSEK